MKIYITGTNFSNKGAELMLYAILQEIERRFPDAEVVIPYTNSLKELQKAQLRTKLKFRQRKNWRLWKIYNRLHLQGICNKLHIPFYYFTNQAVIKNVDYILDAEGYKFGDKCKWGYTDNNIHIWERYFRCVKKNNIKHIFLPQAFGPFDSNAGKYIVSLMSKYLDLVIAREEISYNYLLNEGFNVSKLLQYTDFTSLREGVVIQRFSNLNGGIAIVPNMQMVNTGAMSKKSYLSMLINITAACVKTGKICYFLNHGGYSDYEISMQVNKIMNLNLPILTNLDALEIKGVISTAYAVITARYHALASSLNNCVPALACSWSHKYEMLYKDYGLSGFIIESENQSEIENKIISFLQPENIAKIRMQLIPAVESIKKRTHEMWDKVWLF